MIPDDAVVAADVYKAGRLAAHLWRRGDEVTFVDRPGYEGAPVATSLAQGSRIVERNFQLPAFFAGLLPEGATRRRSVARALHVAEDDELALLVQLGADTIGDVQVLPAGRPLPTDEPIDPSNLGDLTFGDLWAIPQRLEERSTVAGVQPKISHHSRSLIGGRANRVILKFSPDPSWYGVLENEAFFVRGGREVGLPAPEVEVVTDREGERALAVTRLDRSVVGGELRQAHRPGDDGRRPPHRASRRRRPRHAPELGPRPQATDPQARSRPLRLIGCTPSSASRERKLDPARSRGTWCCSGDRCREHPAPWS